MGASALLLLHSPFEGIGAFYNGFLHPWIDPAQAILLVTLGALLGQRGLPTMRRDYPVFLLAIAAGLVLHRLLEWTPGGPVPALVVALCAGGLAASGLRVPALGVSGLTLAAGAWIGLATDTTDVAWGRETRFQFGAGLGAAWTLLVLAGVAELARRDWQKIGVRVVASWGTAAALIVLAFASTSAA